MVCKKYEKKAALLGQSVSAAHRRLLRLVLFRELQISGRDKCYRCGKPMTEDNWSLEHKKSWQSSENPKESYFDLDNVTFSHHKCNSEAGLRARWGK